MRLPCPLSAQSIRGLVLDKTTAAPMVGATVDLPGLSATRGANYDTSGRFTIRDVPAGRYQLRVQYFGYDTEVLQPHQPGKRVRLSLF